MHSQEQLDFVLDIVKLAIAQDRDSNITEVIKRTVSALNGVNQDSRREDEILGRFEFEIPSPQPESPPPAVETYVAPVPKYDDVNEEYDSLRFILDLPGIDSLPKKFDTDKDTVARINDRTVAMACEHYYDLLVVRDECKQLRDDIKSLSESTLHILDTYTAIRDNSEDGIWLRKSEVGFTVMVTVNGEVFHCEKESMNAAVATVVGDYRKYMESLKTPAEQENAVMEVAIQAIEPSFEMKTEAVFAATDVFPEAPEVVVKPLEPSWDKGDPSVDASPVSVSVFSVKREAGLDLEFHDESLVKVQPPESVEEVADDKPEVPF